MDSASDNAGSAGAGILGSLVPLMLRLGTILTGLVVMAGGVLYVKQESLLYFPEIGGIPRRPADNPRGYRSPEERQLPFESHQILCSDGVHIHAWLILAQPAPTKAPTIVFFHGNAGNIGLRLPNALQMLQYLNANILMVEYRGYGNSDDVPPTERGLNLDAEAALRFAHQHETIDSSQIFIFGRSLGGSVAFHVAEYAVQNGIAVAGVMVENTFISISAMVDKLMPFLTPIKPLVLKIGWDSARIVPKLKSIPILFLAGARDELVPHEHMLKLCEAAELSGNPLVQLHVIPDGTHNESWIRGGPAYWDAMRHFMALAVQKEKAGGGGGSSTTATASTTLSTENNSCVDNDEKSSIPIMSSRFIDMAKEAVGAHGTRSSANGNDPKKQL